MFLSLDPTIFLSLSFVCKFRANQTRNSAKFFSQWMSDLLQFGHSFFPAKNYSGKDPKRSFLHPPVSMSKLLESILEVAKDKISQPACCGFQKWCCKDADASAVQHDCSFQPCDPYLDWVLDRISVVTARVSDVRFLRSYHFHRNHGERALIA
jgi:hypothetical protein